MCYSLYLGLLLFPALLQKVEDTSELTPILEFKEGEPRGGLGYLLYSKQQGAYLEKQGVMYPTVADPHL